MKLPLPAIVAFLTDIERLKLVKRRAYVSDLSRQENSAEHSWHLAMGLMIIAQELSLELDLHKALVMALIHDVCEIDADDTPAFGPLRPEQQAVELECIERLAATGGTFGQQMRTLWLEYEEQITIESRWVKVLDRLMPFIVNLAANGRNWKEQSISRSQLLRVNAPVKAHAPEIFRWMEQRIEQCVRDGWLHDA
ncbi:MAG: HD domain-containing protein [Ideonella sp. WA131b]|nr:HD domain-containing protein [Ideonella sp. WA131b]